MIKYKFGMIGCTFLIIILRIIFDIFKLLFLIIFCIPLLFFDFNRFSKILNNIQESIETHFNIDLMKKSGE